MAPRPGSPVAAGITLHILEGHRVCTAAAKANPGHVAMSEVWRLTAQVILAPVTFHVNRLKLHYQP